MGRCRSIAQVCCGLTTGILSVAVVTSASAQALGNDRKGAFTAGPLALKDQGSFFIGGVNKTTQYATNSTAGTNQSIAIGQMYVQFQIPEGWNPNRKGLFPVVMVHGSTHSGAALESTPNFKEGWAPYYVRKGLPVFVVDQAGRGRSGFDESVVHEGKAALITGAGVPATGAVIIPNFGRITNNGSYTSWFGHLVLPGTCTPTTDILSGELKPHGWAACDPSNPSVHPANPGYLPTFPLSSTDPGLKQGGSAGSNTPPGVTANFGPTPFGPQEAYALEYYKQLLPNAEVTLPGSFCETCVPQNLASTATWTPYDLALLVEKIGRETGTGAVVATHSQSGIMGHHMVRLLRQRGTLGYLKGLITVEGGCSFANSGLTAADFDNVPYMAIKGDYTVFSAACQASVDAINARRAAGQGTAKADYIQLDAASYNGAFNGVSHMMMDDTNALQVADVMLDWGSRFIK
jgi:hypothetical protein